MGSSLHRAAGKQNPLCMDREEKGWSLQGGAGGLAPDTSYFQDFLFYYARTVISSCLALLSLRAFPGLSQAASFMRLTSSRREGPVSLVFLCHPLSAKHGALYDDVIPSAYD